MKIGLIADTHGLVRARVFELFRGVECILLAGDIGDPMVVEDLKIIAPVHAVAGNVDMPCRLPERLEIELQGRLFYLVHKIGSPADPLPEIKNWISSKKPNFVIYGHTHDTAVDGVDGVTFVNPGIAGQRRSYNVPSVGIIELNGESSPKIQIYPL